MLTNTPNDPILCHALHPEGVTVHGKDGCKGCAQRNAAGHESFNWASLGGTPVPSDQRISLGQLRRIQHRVSRLSHYMREMEGSATGYAYNSDASLNFADALSWTIVSVSGREITLECDGDPRFRTLYSSRTIEPELGLSYITGGGGWGVVQPNDWMQFQSPSVAEFRQRPSVVRVVSVNETQIVLEMDQDVSGVLESSDPTYTPTSYTCKTWRQAGSPERWTPMIEPRTFFGREITSEVTPDANGHWVLNKAIAAPRVASGFLQATIQVWGYDTDWHDITATMLTRIYCENTPRTTFAFGVNSLTGTGDLAALPYTRFRVRRFERAASGTACGPGRCKHSKHDWTESTNAFNGRTDNWYCAKHVFNIREDVDTDEDLLLDTTTYTWHQPTGLANYQPDCLQRNVCDQYEDFGIEDYFTVWYTFAEWYRQVWCAANIRIDQGVVGDSTPANYTVKRVANPSLRRLIKDSWPLSTPGGYFPSRQFPGDPGSYGEFITTTDVDDNEHITSSKRYNEDALTDPETAEFGVLETYPTPGFFYNESHHDTIAYASALTDSTDPHELTRTHEERAGLSLLRDEGTNGGRGAHRYTHTVPTDEPVLCENVDLTLEDEWQDRYDTRFMRLSVDGTGVIEVKPLTVTAEGESIKDETAIATRTVHSVTDLGDGYYAVELTNTPHYFGYDVAGPARATKTWNAGGGPGFAVRQIFRVNSHEEEGHDGGDDGLQPGDTVSFGDTRRFVVVEVRAHGGSEDAAWGGDGDPGEVTRTLDYANYARYRDRLVVYDESGYMATVTAGATMTGYWSAGYWMGTASLQWTEYQKDEWAPVACTSESCKGRVTIAAALLDAMPDRVCFKL